MEGVDTAAVSYTHLDVYKRQALSQWQLRETNRCKLSEIRWNWITLLSVKIWELNFSYLLICTPKFTSDVYFFNNVWLHVVKTAHTKKVITYPVSFRTSIEYRLFPLSRSIVVFHNHTVKRNGIVIINDYSQTTNCCQFG